MIKIGVVGCGAIARRAHLPGFSPVGSPQAGLAYGGFKYGGNKESVVQAVCDQNRDKAVEAAKIFGVEKIYTDWHELVKNPDIDAISICTPNYLHAPIAIEAAKNGKHVLVEKPMATTMSDAQTMVAAAQSAGVVLMVEQTERFNPVNEIARDVIHQGDLGKIFQVRTRSSHSGPDNWSPGSDWFFNKECAGFGSMADLGIHKLDLIRWLLGEEIVQVAGFTGTLAKPNCEVEDNAVGVLRFKSGAMGVLESSWTTSPGEGSTSIYGSEGNIKMGAVADVPMAIEFSPKREVGFSLSLPSGRIEKCRLVPNIPAASRSGGPFNHFVDCIKTGAAPISSGSDNLKSLEVILAILESSATGKVINL